MSFPKVPLKIVLPQHSARRRSFGDRLRTFTNVLRARLSRRIVARVFLSILAVEVVILVPSYWRQERELLAQLEAVSETAVDAMVRLAERGEASEKELLNVLDVVTRDPLLRGFALYRRDGTRVGTSGEVPTLDFAAIEDFDREICGRLWRGDRYDVARSIRKMNQNYILIVRHDASAVQPQLYGYVLRIAGLVVLIALVVTLATWYALQDTVIMRLLQLRDDLAIAGVALTQGDRRPTFASLSHPQTDELGDTIAAFAAMFDRVEAEIQQRQAAETQLKTALQDLQQAQLQLVQREKTSSLGQLVAGIAHEINNPIGFVAGNTAALNDYARDLLDLIAAYRQAYPQPPENLRQLEDEVDFEYLREDIPKLLTSMQTGTNRVRDIVRSLRNFSRLDQSERKRAQLHEGLDNTLLLLNARLEEANIDVRRQYGEIPAIDCHPAQLNQAFLAILNNAIEAIAARPPGENITRQITLRTAYRKPDDTTGDHAEPGWIDIEIADSGVGMDEATQAKAFDPFFTAKPVGSGTGLGLATAYSAIVQQHGGQMVCETQLGVGTTIRMSLPVR